METESQVRPKPRFNLMIWVVIPVELFTIAGIFIPTLDGPNSRRAAREAVAVGNLRRLITLQEDFAASHPKEGFTCQMSLLKPTAPGKNEFDPNEFLLKDIFQGYKFALTGCEADQDGTLAHFRATAVSSDPGKSGVRAFCTDETAVLWYNSRGSAENCLSSPRTLE